ncbi:MAG: DUF2914 domain-containing protein [Candidatus Paceibacterota bacterium]
MPREKIRKSIHWIKHWYFKYERPISSFSLISGFIFNIFFLTRVDLFIENFWIILHLLFAGAGIIILNHVENEKIKSKLKQETRDFVHFWLIITIQFAFGGLFSTFLVFYFRGATLTASWPFLLLLFIVFMFNEAYKEKYIRLSFQISVLFLSIFSFAIFSVPVLIRRIGSDIFLLSGVVSLVVIGIFLALLYFITRERFIRNKKIIFLSIFGIYLTMNVLYFTNTIPPLPLSLKDYGIYHSISDENNSGNYLIEKENKSFYTNTINFLRSYEDVHIISGDPIYVYTAVFSPTLINIDITHEWQKYDEIKKTWVHVAEIALPIVGGRDGGYRTYSIKANVTPGLWRVNVLTPNGQYIGRIKFKVFEVDTDPTLKSETK